MCLNKALRPRVLMRVFWVWGGVCKGMGWTSSSSWLLWVCVSCSGFFPVGGQTSGCCTQCKSGYAMVKNVRTRLLCNIPGEASDPSVGSCVDACTLSGGKYSAYCSPCDNNFEENRNDCLGPCTKCPVGKIGTGQPDSVCVTCQPGYRVDGFVCTACPAGKYQDMVHQASCKGCEPGTYTAQAAQSVCRSVGQCIPGEYATHAGSSTSFVECAQCGEGTITTSYNVAPACTACVLGKFQTRKGATVCLDHVPCVSGERRVRVGTVTSQYECEKCVAPWTTISGAQTACNTCVAGKYFDTVVVGGQVTNVCTSCACNGVVGTYINCPVGTTSSSTSMCMFCSGTQAGSYCPVGQEEGGCDGTQLGNVACKDCRAGYHKPVQNTKNCVKCPTGTFKVSPGTASCGACTNGPTNSYYTAWGVLEATSNGCLW